MKALHPDKTEQVRGDIGRGSCAATNGRRQFGTNVQRMAHPVQPIPLMRRMRHVYSTSIRHAERECGDR